MQPSAPLGSDGDQEKKSGVAEDVVKVFEFQSDGLATTETWASLATPVPPLEAFSVCLWYEIFYWRPYSTLFSICTDEIIDNAIMLGVCVCVCVNISNIIYCKNNDDKNNDSVLFLLTLETSIS